MNDHKPLHYTHPRHPLSPQHPLGPLSSPKSRILPRDSETEIMQDLDDLEGMLK